MQTDLCPLIHDHLEKPMAHQGRVPHGTNPLWSLNIWIIPIIDPNIEEMMQDMIALLNVLIEGLFCHLNSKAPHGAIQMALWKSSIILEVVHGFHDLKSAVSQIP